MLPPWMNLYSILTGRHRPGVGGRRVGSDDPRRRRALAPRTGPSLLMPIYFYILVWFFRLLLSDRALDDLPGAQICGRFLSLRSVLEPQANVRSAHSQRQGHRKSFGAVEVLKGVSFDVAKGEVVCIIGPSGSGKSTILRCINGLIPIDGGSIRVANFQVEKLTADRDIIALRKEVSIVFQQYNLYPHKTALANIMMAPIHVLKEDPREVEARAVKLLAKVRLTDKAQSYPGELSGGQQQRVAIARALAMRPEIILFDEVTAALDPETVKEVLVTIRELADEGLTCILVTHEMGFAREVADHMYFTDGGVIVEQGPPAEFFTNPKHERTRAFLSQIL
jgi:polar amino acid transport system ATP-binding protein